MKWQHCAATVFLYHSSDKTALNQVKDRYFPVWFHSINGEHFLFHV